MYGCGGKFCLLTLWLLPVVTDGSDVTIPPVALLLNKSTVYCAARNDSSHSAMTWITPIKNYKQESPSWIFDEVNQATETTLEGWNNVTSLKISAPPLSDSRWEGLPIVNTTGNVREHELLADLPNVRESWGVGLSVRAAHDAHILLCGDGELDGDCYWIILGGWYKTINQKCVLRVCTRGSVPKSKKSPSGECKNNTSIYKGLLVREDRWLHLWLKWDTATSHVSVWEQGKSEPFLFIKKDGLFKPKHLLVRSRDVPALWKLHEYWFLYTETPGSYIVRSQDYNPLCISLQYFVSPQGSLQIEAYGEMFEDYRIQDDGQWHEIHVVSRPRKENNTANIRIIATIRQEYQPLHLGIGNIRECNPKGETRLSYTNNIRAVCQLIQHKGLSLQSSAVSATGDTGYLGSKFMPGFVGDWSSLLGNGNHRGVAVCTPRSNGTVKCLCSNGWRGNDCDTKCDPGTYGPGCELRCGMCSSTCSVVDGRCEGVCKSGYHSERCDMKYPVLVHAPVLVAATHTSLVVQITNFTYMGFGSLQRVKIELKMTRDSKWRTIKIGLIENRSNFTANISNLMPAMEYKVRAILIDFNEKSYLAEDVPYTVANTTCDEPTILVATPGRRNITIKLKNCVKQSCPWSWYNFNLLPKNEVKELGRNAWNRPLIFEVLNPYTEYHLLLLRDSNITSITNITTLEDAPTAVMNLTVVGHNSSTIHLKWKPPVLANGEIRGYKIYYEHESYRACKDGERSSNSRGNKSSAELSVVLENLLPYSKYIVSVRALTVEEGKDELLEVLTNEVDIPMTKPVKFTNNVYTTWATVAWQVPPCSTLQGPAENFNVVTRGTSPWNGNDSSSRTVKSLYLEYSDLIPYSDYEVSVFVLSSSGAINPDLPYVTTYTTYPAGPPKVRNLTAYSHGPDWISLRWREPYPPHGILQGYKERHITRSGQGVAQQDITDKTSKCPLWPDMMCCTLMSPTLTANMKYTVQLRAYNEDRLDGTLAEVQVTTKEEASSPPLNLTVTDAMVRKITLTWNHPWCPRGNLKGFRMKPTVLNTNLMDRNSSSHECMNYTLGSDNVSSTYSYTIHELPPSTTFKIQLWAYSSVEGETTSVEVSTPLVTPKFSSMITVNRQRITNSTVEIVLPAAPQFLTDKSTCFVVVTLLEGTMEVLEDTVRLKDNSLKEKVLAFARNDPKQLAWIAAEIELGSEPQTFVVGQQRKAPGRRTKRDASRSNGAKYGDGYSNHPLGAKCTIQVTVVALSEQDGKVKFSTLQLQERVTTLGMPLQPTPPNFAFLSLLFLLLVIPAVGYFVIRRYHNRKTTKDADEISLHVSDRRQERRKTITMDVKVKMKPPIKEPEPEVLEAVPSQQEALAPRLSHRVPLNMLEDYVKAALVDGSLQRQHSLFPRGITKPCEYGRLTQNKSKNRYGNLTAYDATRVVLKKLPNDPFSDYINANYIDGYNASKFYIATQGPKPNTVADFWRMVWQEQVLVICMLANVVENGKTKCEQYWPELGKQASYGQVTVMTSSAQIFADYTFRRLVASHAQTSRTIQHFHFTSWPDHGVPLYPQSVASYIKKVLAAPKGPGPIVVHCSAGVGRTGTIIQSDANLRMAAAEEAIDVLRFQHLIREQRPNLVDNSDQYKLVHLVLLECLIEVPTEVSCSGDFAIRVRELRSTGEMDRQFARLYKHLHLQPANKDLAMTVDANCLKNRNQDIVPGPSAKIPLNQIYADDPTSTYINAVSVDGFRIKNQFVATQFPLTDTVDDFWRMVLEKNISMIIVLNEIDLSDESITEFLPEMDAPLMPSPRISVKLNQVTDSNRWTLKFLQIDSTDTENGAGQVSVRLLQFKGWKSEQVLPPSTENLVLLWHETERLYMGTGPILTTCLDGVMACGLFLSLAFVVEKLKLEQLCDVCLAIRTVRQNQDKFISTQEQFEFLYDAATTYLDGFQTYANFQ